MRMEVLNDYIGDSQIIELEAGDHVQLGERSNPNGPHPNWIHCKSDKTGKAGWVAAHLLTMAGNMAIANARYTSEEMTVASGDIVDTVYELNGWYWCKRLSDQKEAWVEKGNLKDMK